MRLSWSFPPFQTVLAVAILAVAFAFPANAETGSSRPPAASTANPGASATSPSVAPGASQSGVPASKTAPEAAPKATAPATESSGTSESPSAEPQKPKSSIVINIDKSKQEMTVFVDGVELYTWPVSTGRPGYSTPSGSYTARSMNKIWYSKQWDNAPMPHAIFFTKEGHAIHGTLEEKYLGKPASHGCVRLSRQNAATLYALVEANGVEQTQIVLTGTTPGGEGEQVAGPSDQSEGYPPPPWFEPGYGRGPGYGYPPPQRRRGFFGRWLFDGPQGYYAPPPPNRYYYPPPGYRGW
jgi:lipoprotein-anchoring transpeptidase ErfK/SrfK